MAFKSAALVLLLLVCRSAAVAGSTSASMAVGATVASSCLASTSPMMLPDYVAEGINTQSSVSVDCTSFTNYTIASVQRPMPGAMLTTPKGLASCPVLLGCTLGSRPYTIAAREQSPRYFSISRQVHPGSSPPQSVTTESITVIVTY